LAVRFERESQRQQIVPHAQQCTAPFSDCAHGCNSARPQGQHGKA
jgi:hypothetical protein